MAVALAIQKIEIGEILFSVDFHVPVFAVAVYGNQAVRLWIGERLEQHAADQAEHHGGRSDAKSQGQQRDRDKPGTLPKAAKGITHVLKEVRGPAPSTHIPRDFFGDGDVSKFAASGIASLFFGLPGRDGFALGKE